MRRLALGAASVVCVALAVGALPARGRHRALERRHGRRRRPLPPEPESEGLWQPDTVLPFAAAKRLLGTGDDVAFREAVRALRLGQLELGITSDPELALSRGEARARLQQVATEDSDRIRRSRATNLIGVSLRELADRGARPGGVHPGRGRRVPDCDRARPGQPRGEDEPRAGPPARACDSAVGSRWWAEPVARRLGREGRRRRRPRLGVSGDLVQPHLPVPEGRADRARGARPAGRARPRRPAREPPSRRASPSRAHLVGVSSCRRVAAAGRGAFGVAAAQPVAERRRRSMCGPTPRRTS